MQAQEIQSPTRRGWRDAATGLVVCVDAAAAGLLDRMVVPALVAFAYGTAGACTGMIEGIAMEACQLVRPRKQQILDPAA